MTTQTLLHRQLDDHIRYGNGNHKTVCVSTCLSYFGIKPNEYRYTTSRNNLEQYVSVLRRKGYAVRSRMTEFKVKSRGTTMTKLKAEMRKSKYGASDMFIVHGTQTRVAHLMVLNGNGEIIIDTAPNKKWKIVNVKQVFKA